MILDSGYSIRVTKNEAKVTTDFTDLHRLVATKTQRHEGVCSVLAYSAEVILVPKGTAMPFCFVRRIPNNSGFFI
jgi:hypothetical protein